MRRVVVAGLGAVWHMDFTGRPALHSLHLKSVCYQHWPLPGCHTASQLLAQKAFKETCSPYDTRGMACSRRYHLSSYIWLVSCFFFFLSLWLRLFCPYSIIVYISLIVNTVFNYGNMKLEINNDVNINGSIKTMLVEMCQKGSSSQASQNNVKPVVFIWYGKWFLTRKVMKRLQAWR